MIAAAVGTPDLQTQIEVDTSKPVMKFRLNIGQHCGHDEQGRLRLWQQGQRIATRTHLTKRMGDQKFTRISDGDPTDEGQPFVLDVDQMDINKDDINEYRTPTFDQFSQTESGLLVPKSDESAPSGDKFDQGIGGQDASAYATLNAMTVPDLTKLAAEEEVDLTGLKTKAQIISKLMQGSADRAQ